MEFIHFDMGMISQKRADQVHRRVSASSWATLIMQAMMQHVPDAASYAPVTLLIDERADGVHLS
jgi:hypothetical protein